MAPAGRREVGGTAVREESEGQAATHGAAPQRGRGWKVCTAVAEGRGPAQTLKSAAGRIWMGAGAG